MVRLSATYTRAINAWQQVSLPVLRVALGIVYVWFGAEKIGGLAGRSTGQEHGALRHATPMVRTRRRSVRGRDRDLADSRVGLRVMLPLFVAHLMGTFGVLVIQPGVAFQHGNPLLLTATGEFVIKNLVLLSAGLAVVCWQASTSLATRAAPKTAPAAVPGPITAADPAVIAASRET